MNPFDLGDDTAYQRWRQWKLDLAPRRAEDLVVAVSDPLALSGDEKAALAARCQVSNMAFYAAPAQLGEDKALPRTLGAAFGLHRLDANWLADEDGISSIRLHAGEARSDFIPYTERPIRWHTDGYYNSAQQQIRGMILHCVRPAAQGGENAVMDPEMAYILLRDANPDYVRALSAPAVMTIPARPAEGATDEPARCAASGPVFFLSPECGDLHMRYTARTRSIVWSNDAITQAATQHLSRVLDTAASPWIYRLRMEAGMGLLCNNVLHDRAGFLDPPDAASTQRRLLYRARFFDRIAQTCGSYRQAFS